MTSHDSPFTAGRSCAPNLMSETKRGQRNERAYARFAAASF
jgi:hypothetical protein